MDKKDVITLQFPYVENALYLLIQIVLIFQFFKYRLLFSFQFWFEYPVWSGFSFDSLNQFAKWCTYNFVMLEIQNWNQVFYSIHQFFVLKWNRKNLHTKCKYFIYTEIKLNNSFLKWLIWLLFSIYTKASIKFSLTIEIYLDFMPDAHYQCESNENSFTVWHWEEQYKWKKKLKL